MLRRIQGLGPGAALFAAVFAGYYLGSRVAFELLSVADLGAVFFAPSGVMVGALVLSPRRRWWLVIAAGALAEAVIDVHLSNYGWRDVTGFVVANMAETVAVAGLVLWRLGRRPDLSRRLDLTVFVAATVIGTAGGAGIGSWTIWASGSGPWWPGYYQWWLGDGLGILIVGAAIVARTGSPDRRSLWSLDGMGIVLAVTLVALAIYDRTDLPIGFLVLVGVIPAAARFGTRAVTVLFVLVMAVVLLLVTTGDLLTVGLDESTALLIFKLQFAAFSCAGLYVAAESAERERALSVAVLDHQAVQDLQEALLPAPTISGPGFEARGVYQAASTRVGVGGDWYDVVELDDGCLLVCVGDVVGHGTSSVVTMGQLRFVMRGLAGLFPTPGELLDQMDVQAARIEGAIGTTVWMGVIDPARGVMEYSSAGHLPALLISGRDSGVWLEGARSVPLAVAVGSPPHRPTARAELSGPTELFLFTDGVVERRGEVIDVGLDRLRRSLIAPNRSTLTGIIDALKDPEQRDDSVLLHVTLALDPTDPDVGLTDERPIKGELRTSAQPGTWEHSSSAFPT